jgi:lycopene cyclase domain-containing protein
MSYTVAALAAVAVAVTLDVVVLRTRLVLGTRFWTTYAIVVGFQLLTNGVLTGRHIVSYDPQVIIGWRVAFAPVEDVLYGLALVLATLAAWERVTR